jgi:hypothetical protein
LHAALKHPEANEEFILRARRYVKEANAIAKDAAAAMALAYAERAEADRLWSLAHPGLHPLSAKRLGRPREVSPAFKKLYEENRAMDGCVISFKTWCQCKAGN